jgi:hypothetical protein
LRAVAVERRIEQAPTLTVKFSPTVFLVLALSVAPSAIHAKELTAVVHDYIAMFEASAKKPQPVCYPELAERMRGIFPSHGARRFENWALANGRRKVGGAIYVEGTQVEIIAPAGEWNLSTDDNYIYEWVTGSKRGLRIKRVNEDLVALLYYYTDPSWIMASLYYEYLQAPKTFHVVPNPESKVDEIVFNKPMEGFEALYVSHNPLWFHGFRAHGDEVRFSRPQEEKEIPKAIRERREKIEFTDSNESLQRHMVFL